MARTTTFQRSLFGNLAGSIVFLGALFLAMGALNIRHSERRIATELTGRALADTKETVARYLEPVSSAVAVSARHFAAAGMEFDDPERLDRYFMPILATNQQVAGAALAHPDGRSYLLSRTALGWERRLSDPARSPGRSLLSRWSSQDSEPAEEWQDKGFDARTRPWFRGAIARSPHPERPPRSVRPGIHLTRPYEFRLPEGEHGITASVTFRGPDGSVGVIAFDLLLRDITAFAAEVAQQRSGNVTVLYRDVERDESLLAGLPKGVTKPEKEALDPYLLVPPSGLSDTVLDFIAAILADAPDDRLRPRRFESGGSGWWGAAAGYTEHILILATFPESELLSAFSALNLSVTGLTLLLIGLMVWRSSRLSRLYAQPVEELASRTERMAGLDFHPGGKIRTHIEEIQLLAQAHERMRRSLAVIAARREDVLIARSIRGEAKVPSERVPRGYELGLLDQPMEAVGGSVFEAEVYPDSPGKLSLLVAAVPGEGVATAHEAGRVRSVFQTGVRLRTSLEEQARLVRSHFAARPELQSSLGVCVAELDGAKAALWVLPEEACPVAHFVVETGTLRWIEFGPAPERIELAEGDAALLLTESVLRALSPDRVHLGRAGLEEIVRKHARETADSLAHSIGAALDEFTGGVAPERDRTLLVVRRGADPSG